MSFSDTVRRLGLGKLALQLYHRPVGRMRDSLRNGGPLAERATERQRREMESAAAKLPPLPEYPGTAPARLFLLTGRRFWYQTAFCLHSFARAAGVAIEAELYDDGTVDAEIAERFARLGHTIRLHRIEELRAKVEKLLPRDRFPILRERWDNYPNIRKLINVHLGSSGWKLVIDSDLLFFRRPDLILQWLAAPDRILHAVDCDESYGYSRPLLEQLAGAPLPPLLNVGICGLRSDTVPWDQLEAWTSELQRREKTHYYLEQALIAMLAAREPATPLPLKDYITKPTRVEVRHPSAVMHHYVDNAKRWYFRYGWRHFVPRA